ncbi:hypothetical protein RB653_009769 [Dictyostelium firmibasis]|uniref:GP-PDE domain-containing protein n=1 Tax=Dictyostelium firmibasis TaxID=79012 RepID=A0AAN7YLG1_9MYCE
MKDNKIKLIIYFFIALSSVYIYYMNQQLSKQNILKEVIYEKYQNKQMIINGEDKPLILAHRGSRYLLPENTILAFKTALDIGADVIETDVRKTIDGELVIFHDKSVERTTDGKGDVEELTLKQLKSLDAGYKFTPDNGTTFPYRGKGVKVATVREMFESLDANTQFNIEIKEDDLEVAEKLWKEIEHQMETTTRKPRSILIGSRYCSPTAHLRTLAKLYQTRNNIAQLPISTSACEKDVTKFVILNQLFLGPIYFSLYPITSYECFQVPVQSGPIHLDTLTFIDTAHHFGKHVHFWVVNFKDEIDHLLTLPVDGIISDRSDRVVEEFKDHNIKSKQFQIPKPLPSNSTGTYFLPQFDIDENHTCVTITCLLMQRIHQIVISLIFSFLVLKIVNFRNNRQALNQTLKKKN